MSPLVLWACADCGADVVGLDADGDHASWCRWWDARCMRCGAAGDETEGLCLACWELVIEPNQQVPGGDR